MVTEGDHFSYTTHFLKKYLTDFRKFSSFENLLPSFSNFGVFYLKKIKIIKFVFPFLSFQPKLENNVGNMIQHIRKPRVKKFHKKKAGK